jgi:hypothetical protein
MEAGGGSRPPGHWSPFNAARAAGTWSALGTPALILATQGMASAASDYRMCVVFAAVRASDYRYRMFTVYAGVSE